MNLALHQRSQRAHKVSNITADDDKRPLKILVLRSSPMLQAQRIVSKSKALCLCFGVLFHVSSHQSMKES
jgi:hypothetical protein